MNKGAHEFQVVQLPNSIKITSMIEVLIGLMVTEHLINFSVYVLRSIDWQFHCTFYQSCSITVTLITSQKGPSSTCTCHVHVHV